MDLMHVASLISLFVAICAFEVRMMHGLFMKLEAQEKLCARVCGKVCTGRCEHNR